MPKLLITGGNGMVGSYAPSVFGDWELLSTDLDTMDIRDRAALDRAFREFRPELVLHLAAATDVDRCQKEADWAYSLNAVGTQNVALACRKAEALLIYVSTGAVFPGDRHTPYTEFDPVRPSNTYAAAKLAGEELVRGLWSRHLIVRGGWIFGGGAKDHKFVGKLAQLIVSGKTPLKAVNDKFGTPTYAKDLLKGIRRLVEADCLGLFHMANEGSATRYDVAVEIQKVLGDSRITVEPVSSDLFPLPAPRASEALRNYKLHLMGLAPQRPWREALRDYIENECQALLGKARA